MNQGFSLVESLVIISIISILASLSLTALPAARSHQQLISDTELIKSLLTDSKQRALNQVRPEDCLRDDENPQSPSRAGCSDVGIHFSENTVTQFADANKSGTYNGGDYTIAKHEMATLSGGEDNAREILFKSVPPSVEAYKDGGVMSPSSEAIITLTASSGEIRTLTVKQFGTVDIQ